MLRFLFLTATLSTTLISFMPNSAISEQPSRTFRHPTVSNPGAESPVCYMQTADGTTLNLSNICGTKTVQSTIPCPEITDPQRRALFAQSCGNNASCLANLGCQAPPPPTYIPRNGSLPG